MKKLKDTNARILTALTHVKAIDKKWKRHYTSKFSDHVHSWDWPVSLDKIW